MVCGIPGFLIGLFLNSKTGIIFYNDSKKKKYMLFWVIFSVVVLLVVSVSLFGWYAWTVQDRQVDSSKVDREYRWLLQRVTTLLSEYEVTHFVYGKTLGDLRSNRYLSSSLCVAVDEKYREMMEGLEKYHMRNDFSMSVDMFQLVFKKGRFSVKNNKEVVAEVSYYKLEDGKIKMDRDKIEMDMDSVFPLQAELMDNMVVMMPSRNVIVGKK